MRKEKEILQPEESKFDEEVDTIAYKSEEKI